MSRRHEYFSLEEANAMIPTLEYFFRQLSLIQRDLVTLQKVLLDGGAEVNAEGVQLPLCSAGGLVEARHHYAKLCEEFEHVMTEIFDLGVEVLDPQTGVVNFYTWCDGEEVVLNWQFGEPAIQYWLDPGEQFTERRPLRQLIGDAPGPHAARH